MSNDGVNMSYEADQPSPTQNSVVSKLPWFRLYGETVDDEKLRLLAFEDRWHYVAILCCKNLGILDKQVDLTKMRRRVAVKLGVDSRTMDEIERRLVAEGLIESGTLQPLQWDRRQFRSDSSAARTRDWRARQGEEGDGQEAPPKRSKYEYTPEFEIAWSLYPDRPGCNKLTTFKAWLARLANNRYTAQQMTDGVRRYAAYCRAMGTEPRFIKQPATFFGPDEHFLAEWKPPIAGVPPATARSEQRSSWTAQMTGRNGGHDDRPGDYIDVAARTV